MKADLHGKAVNPGWATRIKQMKDKQEMKNKKVEKERECSANLLPTRLHLQCELTVLD